MLTWIQNNWVTVVTVAILAAVLILAAVSVVRKNKKRSCGGGCSSCPYCSSCHGGK